MLFLPPPSLFFDLMNQLEDDVSIFITLGVITPNYCEPPTELIVVGFFPARAEKMFLPGVFTEDIPFLGLKKLDEWTVSFSFAEKTLETTLPSL